MKTFMEILLEKNCFCKTDGTERLYAYNEIEKAFEEYKESVPAETLVMPKTDRTKTIKHLYDSACGYGFADIMKHKDNSGYEKFASILNAIPEELFSEFIYTLYRIAEKSGDEGFSA